MTASLWSRALMLGALLTPGLPAQVTDWANLARYREANAALGPPKPDENRVVFMGNSITEGWARYFPSMFPGKPYVGRGIGGQTTPQMLVRFRQDVIALRPKVVVILAGTNDIAGNTGPSTLEMIEDNLASMAELAMANGIRVVLSSVLPVYDYPWRPGIQPAPKIVALNAWMKDWAARHGAVYLDYHSAMADDRQGLRSELGGDGVHPNEAGYRIMAPLAELAIRHALRLPSPRATPARVRPDSGTLVMRIGRDTAQVEWFVVDSSHLQVIGVRRIPNVQRWMVDGTLSADGTIFTLGAVMFDPRRSSDSTSLRTVVRLEGDSTVVTTTTATGTRRRTHPGRAMLMFVLPDFVFSSLIPLAQRAPASLGDSLVGRQPVAGLGDRTLIIRRRAPNEVTIGSNIMGTLRVLLQPDGRVAGIDGTGSSLNYVGTRVPWMNIDSVVGVFLERESRAGVAGTVSPRDSVVTSIGPARLTLSYGRPSVRGRRVFGGIVPWGRVWRTGANLATHFTTDRPLVFGRRALDPGSYTLWTLPTPNGWTLIINRQTGQWGTDYDPGQDVMRIPMRVRSLRTPVEQLELTIDQWGENRGVLRVRWDRIEASAPFVIRP